MIAHAPFSSPIFDFVANGLVELHRLIREGKDDSPEAESVRDALDGPLMSLSPTEKERAQMLSDDLYSISEPRASTSRNGMDAQAQQQFIEASEARRRREWDRSLGLLRNSKDSISPALLSYIRGSIWEEAGYPAVAAAFLGHASESDPANANWRALYLVALAESDPEVAAERAAQVLAEPESFAPVVVVEAANIRFSKISNASDAESAQLCRELIPILERNLARIDEQEGAAGGPGYEMSAGKLGVCNELLGNSGAAINYFSLGLRANPDNDGLLAARGTLQYGRSPRAITDFERAVELGSSIIWPYFFLAHHYLATRRYDQCSKMCEMGARMAGSDAAKSQLEEWRAIAGAALGVAADVVREAFEAAVRLDPSNDLARRNLDAFEASLAALRTSPTSWWEQKSAATVRQFGLAERRCSIAA
jgi:tetratricopeptide (TPR) repeat protein